jgi:putative addiction module component (TIGR02574 family)
MVSLKEIKAAVPELSPEEREELRAFLGEFDDSAELSPAWKTEIERRVADYRSGKTKGVPLEDVMDELERRS